VIHDRLLLVDLDGERECGGLAWLGADRDVAAEGLDDLAADRQAEARAGMETDSLFEYTIDR
jgi:hypothetical protein